MIEVSDTIVIEDVRIIGEPDFIINPITTGRMLTRLLQIKNGSNIVSSRG